MCLALDIAWAAGLLSKELDASRPVINHEPGFQLHNARHLLVLAGANVIANDISLVDPAKVLGYRSKYR